jgi:prepilin-type N-terminal cleavage/methylation domain-containing protein
MQRHGLVDKSGLRCDIAGVLMRRESGRVEVVVHSVTILEDLPFSPELESRVMIKRYGKPLVGLRGFTLIELLVVIAIIALLISILLPSLDAARRQAKQSACVSQLKNIASSSRVYEADDPSGWGIPVHPLQFQQISSNPTFIGAYEWGGKSGIGRQDFTDRYGGHFLSSKYGTWAGFGPATRPLNDILYTSGFVDYRLLPDGRTGMMADTELDLGLFKCAGDDGPPKGDGDGEGPHCKDWILNTERTSYDHFGTSYAANIFMIAAGQTEMRTNSPYLRPTTRVPTPARTLYYEENIGRWAWSAQREIDDCIWIGQGVSPGPTGQIRGWHGKDWTYNRAFVDAHAEYQRIYIEGTEQNGFATHYRNERLGSYPSFGGQQGTFDANRCIIVRGDGWQKDTMPASTIGTGLQAPGGGRPSYEGCVTTQ